MRLAPRPVPPLAAILSLALVACGSSSSPQGDGGLFDPLTSCTKDPGATAPAFDPNSATDPTGGSDKFTLAMALAGFPAASGRLTAALLTDKGYVTCVLDEAAAPISTANFVGLARGTRPYKIAAQWQVGHFYDGLIFHRVIPDFVIQGGDPTGTGFNGPGYDLPVENQVVESVGTLAMAAGAKPNGSQFYVVVGAPPAASYNVFGSCRIDTATAISKVDTGPNNRPNTPVHIQSVAIGRCN